MSVARIKRNDEVVAISGAFAGQRGKVLKVDLRRGRALVEGLNVVKKTMRRSQEYPEGAIIEREAPIALSKLMPYDAQSRKGVRISRVRDGERTVRKARGSDHVLDQ